jgi:DNA-binding response OmpR family regulator
MKPHKGSVLLVEDHPVVAAQVGRFLELYGYQVDYAADGTKAVGLGLTHSYDAIVLDVGLPRLSGLEVCKRLRAKSNGRTPILMLTVRATLRDKVAGLEAGGDDYLTKPFEPRELDARLRALIRRARGDLASTLYRVDDLTLDTATKRAVRAGCVLSLSPTEIRLLQILMRASPAVVKRPDIERELWGFELPRSDVLRSHLYNLRKTIDRPFLRPLLHTAMCNGYRIAAVAAEVCGPDSPQTSKLSP